MDTTPQAITAPTGRLRFYKKGDRSVLQQEFAVMTLPARSRSFEWHDVPMVEEQVLQS